MSKAKNTGISGLRWLCHPAAAYTAPFIAYVAFLALERVLPAPQEAMHIARLGVTALAILLVSRKVLPGRPLRPFASALAGFLVFAVWVAPDLLWPAYRTHWLFANGLTGSPESSIARRLHADPAFIAVRILSSILLVPVLEELFWRGWLMRWIIRKDFGDVPLGTYTAASFWVTALLFASEHGPYWDVGLAAGIAYNGWLVRTRSLADCILAHGVTNTCLAVYVLVFSRWQYWL